VTGTDHVDAPTERHHVDLLTHLTDTAVDDDYARVTAERAEQQPGAVRSSAGSLLVPTAVLAVLGVMVSLALVQSRDAAPLEAAERQVLIEQIEEARSELDATNGRVEALRADVAQFQGTAADLDLRGTTLLDQVAEAGVLVGKGPVTGPGLRITTDDARDAVEGGEVLDTDLQLLANGLWEAGADAIAINGNRLGPSSAIRTAGQAITVNFRPLTPPYVVTAIGSSTTLPARFSETRAGQSWSDLETNYGMRFDIDAATVLALPGVPAGRLRLSHAERMKEDP
jgi:uncharacterized protein YlxW (UPF0749 family)